MAHEHDWDAEYAAPTPPPWDIGEAQPALVAFLDRTPIDDPVLDVGCGTGELALLLAGRGHQVIGVDGSAPAIEHATAKATTRGVDVDFQVGDALHLTDLGVRPRTVIDCGLLHVLDEQERDAYVTQLAEICGPGALVAVLAVSAEADEGWDLTEASLREWFLSPHWVSCAVGTIEVRAHWQGADLRLPGFLLTCRRG
ncbi:class I SAM-dependent methyltransferase [Ruania alba]|uniref:Methyltransferase domain-containing protein n=1 Tax=Ruania alba TaxID=648782 RepID=A0A1H5GVK8_9MICO|nr:class I SAM-dependent methyltransferase [Ruania alba]SEE19710.1 Methyltransferase domain-containing protein [Ruania alba]